MRWRTSQCRGVSVLPMQTHIGAAQHTWLRYNDRKSLTLAFKNVIFPLSTRLLKITDKTLKHPEDSPMPENYDWCPKSLPAAAFLMSFWRPRGTVTKTYLLHFRCVASTCQFNATNHSITLHLQYCRLSAVKAEVANPLVLAYDIICYATIVK